MVDQNVEFIFALQKACQSNIRLGFCFDLNLEILFHFFPSFRSFVLKLEPFQFPLKGRVIRVVDCIIIKFLEDKV